MLTVRRNSSLLSLFCRLSFPESDLVEFVDDEDDEAELSSLDDEDEDDVEESSSSKRSFFLPAMVET